MNFLGISGLEASAPFKQEHWPGLDPREYRISQGYDSAAALVIDGKLVAAAAQERFSRKKHTGDFPIDAIQSEFEANHPGATPLSFQRKRGSAADRRKAPAP